jgi:holliday junction DNA helicase RuvB
MAYFRTRGKEVSPNLCEAVARVGRLVPRIAIEHTEDFLRKHDFGPDAYPLTDDGLRRMMSEFWLVDDQGLTANDVEYLRCVADTPRGISVLVSLLPYGKEEIETVVEPFLLQINAIRRTSRGREITEIGRRIIELSYPK